MADWVLAYASQLWPLFSEYWMLVTPLVRVLATPGEPGALQTNAIEKLCSALPQAPSVYPNHSAVVGVEGLKVMQVLEADGPVTISAPAEPATAAAATTPVISIRSRRMAETPEAMPHAWAEPWVQADHCQRYRQTDLSP